MPKNRTLTVTKGPEWEHWKHVITGRELQRTVGGRDEVGTVLAEFNAMATLTPPSDDQSRFTVAWRDAAGRWRYPDYYDLREGDTASWAQLRGMMQDGFVDHPRLPYEIRQLALPLQENGWHPLPEQQQDEQRERAEAALAALGGGGSLPGNPLHKKRDGRPNGMAAAAGPAASTPPAPTRSASEGGGAARGGGKGAGQGAAAGKRRGREEEEEGVVAVGAGDEEEGQRQREASRTAEQGDEAEEEGEQQRRAPALEQPPTKRRRGRPRKLVPAADAGAGAAAPSGAVAAAAAAGDKEAATPKRKPGRPRLAGGELVVVADRGEEGQRGREAAKKGQREVEAEAEATQEEGEQQRRPPALEHPPAKRGRGRPRKLSLAGGAGPAPATNSGAAAAAAGSGEAATPKRKPGRPRLDGGAGKAGAGPPSAGRAERAAPSEGGGDLGDELAALAAASLIKAKGKGSKAAAAAAEGKGKERKGGKPLGSYPGLTGRAYPAELAFIPGDTLVSEYTAPGWRSKGGPGQVYEVECILDEARVGKKRLFLIKWKGYELDVGGASRNGGWEPARNIADAGLIDDWGRRGKPRGFHEVSQQDADEAMARVKWAKKL